MRNMGNFPRRTYVRLVNRGVRGQELMLLVLVLVLTLELELELVLVLVLVLGSKVTFPLLGTDCRGPIH